MAAAFTVLDRISFGNMKMIVLNSATIPAAGGTYDTGWSRVYAVKANNNSDSSDTFAEKVGDGTNAHGSQTAKSKIFLDPVTADDSGITVVWGK